MENEQIQTPPPLSNPGATNTSTTTTAPSNSSSTGGRQTAPPISVYSGIPDRQTVQVIQQALHRQPNTAAQYLQQMYAAQQQHLMLQTAALQQQHLGSSQLQSLAAIQQASMAANRQGVSSASNGATQNPPQQPTINLATSPAAAQLINRAQSANSAAATASGIAQQAVLLGNTSNPTLSASQAQMYLRAQMLIFTPTVATVQPEGTSNGMQPPTTSAPQVQNPALRTQQAVSQVLGSTAGQQQPPLAIKPAPNNHGGHSCPASPAAQLKGAKEGGAELLPEHLRKGEGGGAGSSGGTAAPLDGRGSGPSRTGPLAPTHPPIAPAYPPAQTQSQPQQQTQPKPLPHQFVIQQQLQPKPPHLPAFNAPGPSAPPAPLPACRSPPQHKPNSSQTSPRPPGPPALGLQRTDRRPAGCPNHTTQHKFQHTSAVILQLQPPVGTLPMEGPRKDPVPALLSPEAACLSPSAPPKALASEGTGPPPHGNTLSASPPLATFPSWAREGLQEPQGPRPGRPPPPVQPLPLTGTPVRGTEQPDDLWEPFPPSRKSPAGAGWTRRPPGPLPSRFLSQPPQREAATGTGGGGRAKGVPGRPSRRRWEARGPGVGGGRGEARPMSAVGAGGRGRGGLGPAPPRPASPPSARRAALFAPPPRLRAPAPPPRLASPRRPGRPTAPAGLRAAAAPPPGPRSERGWASAGEPGRLGGGSAGLPESRSGSLPRVGTRSLNLAWGTGSFGTTAPLLACQPASLPSSASEVPSYAGSARLRNASLEEES
ncbi:polyhomeotic-like 2 [Crotalus adamanteus]|uniref:Polyhomeotic-like 2 n=1 Tax=Crotalus adamanteus TaxID=8729 RepID=A0AAW1ARL9_CROAD